MKYHESAEKFLTRLDAVKEVFHEHPIFLEDHPEDWEIDTERKPRISRCCFTNAPTTAISMDSHRYKVRQIAERNAALVKTLPYQLSTASAVSLSVLLRGASRLLIQLTRPLLFIVFLYLFVNQLYYFYSADLTMGAIVDVYVTVYAVALVSLAFSFTQDDIFKREFCCFHSRVKHGIYFNKRDRRLQTLVKNNEYLNGKNPYKSTPWLYNGDLRTAIPFALFEGAPVHYLRRWVHNSEDDESVAMDIAFPSRQVNGQTEYYHDPAKHVMIVLHGLNGGSDEPYILDFVHHHHNRGHTVVAMVGRGLMGTPIIHGHVFNGCRLADLQIIIHAIHAGCGNLTVSSITNGTAKKGEFSLATAFEGDVMNQCETQTRWTTPIAATGFSMGGMVVANYCVVSGKHSGLTSGIALAACGDCNINTNYQSSKQNWQGFLTFALKANLIVPNPHFLAYPGGSSKKPIDIDAVNLCTDIHTFDSVFTAPFNGFSSVYTYYNAISFATPIDENNDFHGTYKSELNPDSVPLSALRRSFNKLDNLFTPLLIVHADDDPVLHVDCLEPALHYIAEQEREQTHAHEGSTDDEYPQGVLPPVKDDDETYLVVHVVRGGGHVGQPIGWNPFKANWEYLTLSSLRFAEEASKIYR